MDYLLYKKIIHLVIIISIFIILWLLFRYNIKPDIINPYYSEFNKLISKPNNNLLSLGSIKIEPEQIDKKVRLGNYVFKVKLVHCQITYKTESTILSKAHHYKDNNRKITVYIDYNGYISTIILNGKFDNYNNLYTNNLKIDEINTQYHDIYYSLAIEQIYVHDGAEDWYGLTLVLNKNVQINDEKIKLSKNASNQPIKTNLLNPLAELLYDNNRHAYKTPYRTKVDNYGVINKDNKDNINRTINIIRETINNNNDNNNNMQTS